MLDRIEANGPAFDGMKDYGAHLVVYALLDARVDMNERRKAVFVAFIGNILGRLTINIAITRLLTAFRKRTSAIRISHRSMAALSGSYGFRVCLW
jgi:hypothetical protein